MKRIISIVLISLIVTGSTVFPITKEEVKQLMLDEFTAQDYIDIKKNEKKKIEDSAEFVPYIEEYNVGGGGGFWVFLPNSSVNDNKFSQVDDVSYLTGGAGGFIVNLSQRYAVGGLFGGFGGFSEKKVGDDYYHYGLGGMFKMAILKYRPIIEKKVIVDLDLGLGLMSGAFSKYKTNESFSGTDVYRKKANKLAGLLGTHVRYRLNNLWTTGVKAGYMFADLGDLERAGSTDSSTSLDLSGVYLAVTMGGNF